MCRSPGAMYACPGRTRSPSLASLTVILHRPFRRAAKLRVKPGGMCWVISTAGESALNRVITSRIASVPPVEALIAIGASTGGTEAIREVITRFNADSPAVLITQHMPPGFTRSFAARLNGLCRMTVSEAKDGERVLPGHAYIAPGDRHMKLERSGANYVIALDDGPPVNRHRPSVDVLFRSVAAAAGQNALGVMLTGMGRDGASAMLEMKQAGAFNLAQDEASCVVFGMPKEAIAVGAVDEVLPITRITERLQSRLAELGA